MWNKLIVKLEPFLVFYDTFSTSIGKVANKRNNVGQIHFKYKLSSQEGVNCIIIGDNN